MFDIVISDPAFGDSDDEDMQLNNDLGGNMDDLGEDFPHQAGTISMTFQIQYLVYCTYVTYGTYRSRTSIKACSST